MTNQFFESKEEQKAFRKTKLNKPRNKQINQQNNPHIAALSLPTVIFY